MLPDAQNQGLHKSKKLKQPSGNWVMSCGKFHYKARKMKKNPRTINEHFDQKYGKPGTKSRLEFEIKAKAFVIEELKKVKKEADNKKARNK
jgi:hypothetical protein